MSGPFLRRPVVWLTQHPWFRRLVTGTPPGRAVARRFVAGESLEEALAAARRLRGEGIATMLDHLGENVRVSEQAAAAASAYVRALERLREEGDRLDCAVSIKLSQLGIDLSSELCSAHVGRVLDAAEPAGTLVMIDMESSAYVDRTLELFGAFRGRYENLGLCLQAYLRRTIDDVVDLPPGSSIRLVKGAYLEPPELAFTNRRQVDRSFSHLVATLLSRGHPLHVATHDSRLLESVRRLIRREGIPRSLVEFQMLYGIRRDLQTRLAGEGYAVRVYVPYGTEWYPYLTRRLAERPANMWFFLSNLVRSER